MKGVKYSHIKEMGSLRLTEKKKRQECAWEVIALTNQLHTLETSYIGVQRSYADAFASAGRYKDLYEKEKADDAKDNRKKVTRTIRDGLLGALLGYATAKVIEP